MYTKPKKTLYTYFNNIARNDVGNCLLSDEKVNYPKSKIDPFLVECNKRVNVAANNFR